MVIAYIEAITASSTCAVQMLEVAFAADVLLTGLQGQSVCRVALGIDRNADQATGIERL